MDKILFIFYVLPNLQVRLYRLVDPFHENDGDAPRHDVGTVGGTVFPYYKMQIVPLILILRVLKSGAADGSVSRDYVATKEAS